VDKLVFLNGEFVPEEKAVLHFRDLSVQRGYGVFDFLKVVNGLPAFLEDHLDRFAFSAQQMHLTVGYSKEELKKIIGELLERNKIVNTGVRLTLTGGYSTDGYQLSKPNLIISCHAFTPPGDDQLRKGIKLVTYPHQRQLPHVKSIDYLMGIWLQPFIRQGKADDVLYHQNGMISECPRSNFFIVTNDDRIVTPSKNILKGVNRAHLIEIARSKFEVEERDLTIDEMRKAKEAFITSTTKVIIPVRQIDEHIFTGPDQICTELRKLLLRIHPVQPA